MKKNKLMIIGLDCAPPELVFDSLAREMPFVSSLRTGGAWGPMRSTDPPITVPAWSAMLSGLDPGQLGFYGFHNRAAYDYEPLWVADSRAMKAMRVWDYANEAGLSSLVIGVPQTYPPRPLNGVMVSGFLAPNSQANFTFPASLKERLPQLCGGEYLLDARGFRTEDKERLLKEIRLMTKRRFELARNLAQEKDWDFFMLVEMGPDRLHHGFWRFFDPDHPRHQPNSPLAHAIPDYYRLLDQEIQSLWRLLPPDALMLIVSDHGAQAMQGGLAINRWLIKQGWLSLKESPKEPTPLRPEMVDWPRTLAWGEGGYYSRIFLNIAGREPQGALPAQKVNAFKKRLSAEMEAMAGPDGAPLGNRMLDPARLYHQTKGVPPDLMLYPGDLRWRSLGLVGPGGIFEPGNDTGPDDANHSPWGIFLAARKGSGQAPAGAEQRLEAVSIYDVAPTALAQLGLNAPPEMTGKRLAL